MKIKSRNVKFSVNNKLKRIFIYFLIVDRKHLNTIDIRIRVAFIPVSLSRKFDYFHYPGRHRDGYIFAGGHPVYVNGKLLKTDFFTSSINSLRS